MWVRQGTQGPFMEHHVHGKQFFSYECNHLKSTLQDGTPQKLKAPTVLKKREMATSIYWGVFAQRAMAFMGKWYRCPEHPPTPSKPPPVSLALKQFTSNIWTLPLVVQKL